MDDTFVLRRMKVPIIRLCQREQFIMSDTGSDAIVGLQ